MTTPESMVERIRAMIEADPRLKFAVDLAVIELGPDQAARVTLDLIERLLIARLESKRQ